MSLVPLIEPYHVSREPSSSSDREPLRIQDTVHLSADGLAKVLGDLEARVMDRPAGVGADRPRAGRARAQRGDPHDSAAALGLLPPTP